MSNLAAEPTGPDELNGRHQPPGSDRLAEPLSRPWMRPAIFRLLLATLIGLAVVAHYWNDISVWWKLTRTQELLRTYHDDEALELLRSALLTAPANPSTVIQLSRVHRRLGNLEKALMLAGTAAKLGADKSSVELEHRLIALQSGQIRGFDKEFARLMVDVPDKGPDIFQAYVLGLFANLRTDEAFGLLQGWESSSPSDPQPKFLQAYLYEGIDRLPEAIEAYRKGLRLAPGTTLMRRRMAKVLLDSGEIAEARTQLKICQTESPRDVEVNALLAQCAFAENDFGAALAETDRVLESAPQHVDARRLRGQIRLANGDPQAALADLEFVTSAQSDDTVAREAMGRALQMLGRSDEAKIHFDFVSSASKEQAETIRLIRQVISEPGNAQLKFDIGLRLLRFGPADDGAKWLRTVLEIDPDHPGAHAALADYYQQRGEQAAAHAHRERALAAASKP